LLVPKGTTLTTHILTAGASYNGVRQRISKLRKEQRERFTELGWDMPDGVATKTPTKAAAKTGTPKKRAAGGAEKGEELGGAEGETESPAKKPRARKPKKEVVKKEVEEDDGLGGEMKVEDGGVKEELLGEDL